MGVLLQLHIVTAALALVTGTIALLAAKGATLHRRIGLAFVYALVTMCASATIMAVVKGQTMNVIGGMLTAYLAITALITVRPPWPRARAINIGLMLVALGLGVTTLVFGAMAVLSATGTMYGLPPYPFLMMGTVGVLAAVGDFRTLRSGPLRGAPRLTRHLWRMCWALWITTASFFSIRERVARILPEPFPSPALRVLPVLLVLLAMLYWLWRVRFSRTFRGVVRVAGPQAAEAAGP